MNKTAITIAAAALLAIPSFAQPDRNATLINFEKEGFEYEIKAGVNIGGTVPSPFPAEIRSIDSYSPRLNGSLEGIVTYWMGEERKWGVAAGLRVEVKGMSTERRSRIIAPKSSMEAAAWPDIGRAMSTRTTTAHS